MNATQKRGTRLQLFLLALAVGLPAVGCRQKMAEQPYYRPLEGSDMFEDGRASRPLERGVVHRAQYLDVDPMVTGLTREEWSRGYAILANPKTDMASIPAPVEDRTRAIGAPRFDPIGFTPEPGQQAHAAPPGGIFVTAFPFEIKDDDLRRGKERYTIYCAVCHGPLGNGQGKIWERGYLQPTSFHTEPTSDNLPIGNQEVVKEQPRDVPLGFSRGYGLWGIKIPMRDVPIGYYFEVVTKGYAGMPSYSAQIPPADRWRIIAYIRVLQLSQHADASKLQLPDDVKAKLNAAGGKP